MGATRAIVSIGDEGVLNVQVSLRRLMSDRRDLSWLDFNDRVLAEADERTPLLERAKFSRSLMPTSMSSS
jgi:hypothetical protein